MTNLSENNDGLFTEIANDNQRAFEMLFRSYRDRVYTIALFITRNTQDAEEVVQDIFSDIWKDRKKMTEIKNFEAWITTVSKNRSLSAVRKVAISQIRNQTEKSLDQARSPINTDDQMQVKELQDLINDALDHLTPRQRKIFELSRLQGQDRNFIAHSLGISPATVSVHLTIALRTIRSFLGEHQYEVMTFCLLISLR